jgi:orotate phosphoribosyltransferase
MTADGEAQRRKLVLDLLKLYSVKIAIPGEEFTLASGAKSHFYIDVKKTALHAKVHFSLAHMLYDEASQAVFGTVEGVAGVALGGCHLASIVAMFAAARGQPGLNVFYVRKEGKDHGTKSLVEGPQHGPDHNVVLLEDVVTTGGSSLKAIEQLKAAHCKVAGIVAVIDRRPKSERTDTLGDLPFRSLFTLADFSDDGLDG